jgi:uncharacterized membrane protein
VSSCLFFEGGHTILQKKIRQVFIAGLAVTIPIGLTLYVFFFLISVMDRLLDFIPQQYHPDTIFPFHIPGLGVIATIILIFLCGVLMKSYIGHRIVGLGEMLFYKIPIIRSIYEGTKQIVDSLFVNKTRSFQKVVLVPFPHPGSYTLGFVTGEARQSVTANLGRACVNVFVPTTPNPTSGYLIIVPEENLLDVEMTVEEAFTYIISCGIVQATQNGAIKTG